MKKRVEEIDKQRDEFKTKQQIMDDSIVSITTSVSKLTADILAIRIDMEIMSDRTRAEVKSDHCHFSDHPHKRKRQYHHQ
jgi:hypothetical protein